MLAAAPIGSFEPAALGEVLWRSAALLAGCLYGMLIVFTAARSAAVPARAVHPQTALSYAVLVAARTFDAWFAARLSGLAHGWWLPLAVAAIGEPSVSGTAQRAVAKTAVLLLATVPFLLFIDSVPLRTRPASARRTRSSQRSPARRCSASRCSASGCCGPSGPTPAA